MGDFITQSKVWKFVGRVSAITGLVCFPISSSYDKSFGKLGERGLLSYLLICLIVWILIVHFKRIRVSERVQRVVAVLSFVVICVISVLHDKLLPGKSDAWSIISYGSFALMSLSVSRKLELGFETGFSAFFLQLFAIQLYKTKWFLLPLALFFCSLIIILRYYSASGSGAQSGSSSPTSVAPLNESRIQMSRLINEESQDSLEQSLLHTSNQENNQEESYEAAHLPSSNNGGVSEESILEVVADDQQNNNQEETSSSFTVESWEQEQVSSGNNQNGRMHRSAGAEVVLAEPSGLRRRRTWMTPGIQNIPSRVGATLGRWRWQVVPAFFF